MQKGIENKKTKSDNSNIWQEITEIKSDYKSWLRSIKIITLSATIVIFVLAFFGYDKIEKIEDNITSSISKRLAKTDSLLAQLDVSRIDELNKELALRKSEYEKTINNLNELIKKSRQIEKLMFQSLQNNEILTNTIQPKQVNRQDHEKYFSIRNLPGPIKSGKENYIIVQINPAIKISKIQFLRISIIRGKINKGGTILFSSDFTVNDYINKLPLPQNFSLGKYILRTGISIKEGQGTNYYESQNEITIEK